MRYLKHLFIFSLNISSLFAQTEKFTISGTVKDKKSGETVIGATVRVIELKNVGASTNEYGFYSITIPQGNYTLEISYLGFKKISTAVTVDKNASLNFSLEDNASELNEVVITTEKKDANLTNAQVGVEKLDVKEISKIPVFAGEKDIIKTLQLTPGIKSGGDGNAGFYVRGGGADQNLILLDEAPVYNASHLFGFFSTFNSDAIKDLTVYKGGMPSQYGGRLSSVLDIKMNDGNDQKYHVGGGIGIISSKLNIEGPIVKDRGSFLIAARRTYADMFLKLSNNFKDTKLYFYDLNLKANYRINDKNRIFLSGYFGQDQIGLSSFGINWGNATATLRWNSIISPKFFSNTSLIYSNYNYKIALSSSTSDIDIKSKIRDFNLKQDFTFLANPKNKIRFGFNSIHHTVTPGQISSSDASLNFAQLQERYALENALYVSHEWNATEKLNIIYGLRATSFSLLGDGNFYSYNSSGDVIDTTHYNANQIVKTYFNLEPRFSASYVLGKTNSIKAVYARNVQYLHLLSNSTTSNPTDLWITSSQNVKPEIADQVSLGYFQNFKDNLFEFSTEIYYKGMQNQIDYKNGASTQANDKVEGELLFGKGRAYGIEFFLKKKYGRFNGWVGYTLSRTERHIDGINNGNWYAAKQDRTHDISVVGIYDLNKKWALSASWVFSTGNAVTFPSGKYTVDGKVQYLYTERNGYRMPNYHRLDIGVTWYKRKTEKFESNWNFSIYNAYGRENAYTITFRQSESDPQKTEIVKTSLFRWVPSITYNFKF
ncbi:MAG: collagen-binding protein [Bacteroidetes bacterium RIFCSPLOWO2_12_FULL_37_12]|nr:MAG: collagen-binding protein [Bacteroidetes bacterium RIFCSPLOWO2_12_FULL_37_12]